MEKISNFIKEQFKILPTIVIRMLVFSVIAVFISITVPLVISFLCFWDIFRIMLVLGLIMALRSDKSTKAFGTILIVVIVSFTGYKAFEALFPQTTRAIPWISASGDRDMSKIADSINVKYEWIRDKAQADDAKKMFRESEAMLNAGRFREADSIKAAYYKKWGLTKESEDNYSGFNKDQKKGDPAVSSSSLNGPSRLRTIVLYPGEYHFAVKAGEEIGKFSFPDCGIYPYSISSPSYDYDVVYSPTEKYHGDPNLVIAEKKHPLFSIVARRTEVIKVTVSKT